MRGVRSASSNTGVWMGCSIFAILILVTIPFYIETLPKDDFMFLPLNFLKCVLFNVLACTLFWFFSCIGSKTITVEKEQVIIKEFLGKTRSYPLSAITEISWGSPVANRSISPGKTNYTMKVRADFFIITFKDGFEIEASVKEYSNFDELRGWFLTYGKSAGLINISPLEERKQRGRRNKRENRAKN